MMLAPLRARLGLGFSSFNYYQELARPGPTHAHPSLFVMCALLLLNSVGFEWTRERVHVGEGVESVDVRALASILRWRGESSSCDIVGGRKVNGGALASILWWRLFLMTNCFRLFLLTSNILGWLALILAFLSKWMNLWNLLIKTQNLNEFLFYPYWFWLRILIDSDWELKSKTNIILKA